MSHRSFVRRAPYLRQHFVDQSIWSGDDPVDERLQPVEPEAFASQVGYSPARSPNKKRSCGDIPFVLWHQTGS